MNELQTWSDLQQKNLDLRDKLIFWRLSAIGLAGCCFIIAILK